VPSTFFEIAKVETVAHAKHSAGNKPATSAARIVGKPRTAGMTCPAAGELNQIYRKNRRRP